MAAPVPIRRDYPCATCGAVAATLEIVPEGAVSDLVADSTVGREGPTLNCRDANGLLAQPKPSAELAELANRLEAANDAAAGADLTRSYCPDCKACYCVEHWQLEMVFEDFEREGDHGWYDCTYGTCPAGHRTMLDD